MKQKLLLFAASFCMLFPVKVYTQVKGNAPSMSNMESQNYKWNRSVDLDSYGDNANYNGYNQPAQTGLQQNRVYSSAEDSVFIVESSVMMNVKATSFMAQFHLTQVGDNATICTNDMDARILAFKNDLKNLGISESDFYVDMISFIPLYEYEITKKLFSKTANEVPSGFELKKNIHIRLVNDEILDKVIATAAAHEIYDFAHFEYFVPDHEAIYDTLRKEALRILSEKNEAFKKTGLKIDAKYNTLMENSYCVFPNERYKSYSAFGSQSLGYQKKGGSITVNDVRKPNSYYYDHLPYNSFDQIIHSQILEPEIQFVYSVRMRYVQKKQLPTPGGN